MPEKKTAAKAAKPTAKPETEVKTAEVEKQTFTREQIDALVAEAVKNAFAATQNTTSVKTEEKVFVDRRDEMVTLFYIGLSAPGTAVMFGDLGQFNRAGIPLYIPKQEFLKGMKMSVTKLLDSRIVVLDGGLTDEERKRYGLLYADGEVLSQDEFFNIVKLDAASLAKRFEPLCEEHKIVVLRLFSKDLFEESGANTTIDKIKALKKIVFPTQHKIMLALIDKMLDRLGARAVEIEE